MLNNGLDRCPVQIEIAVLAIKVVCPRYDFETTRRSFYGVGDGFYLVLPLLGPAAVRDAVGAGVDGLLDPRSYLLTTETQLALYLAGGIVIRERELDSVDFLTENAEDPYVAVRAWIYQQRERDFDTNCLKRKALSCPDR